MNIVVILISIALIIIGTICAILPVIPGLPLALAGLWIYGFYTHFQVVSLWAVVIFTLLAGLVEVLNILAPALGAKGYKSSRLGVAGAMLGAILGIAILGPIGIVMGPFLGAFLGEFINAASAESAFKSARGALIGGLVGTFSKIILGLSMLIYFVIALTRQ